MIYSETARTLAELAKSGAMSWEQIISNEIAEFRANEKFAIIRKAERYYRNRSSVQQKQNEFSKRSNTKIEHAIVRKLVEQKADYLLSKPFTVSADTEPYDKALSELFDNAFRSKIYSFAKAAVKSGIAYLIPYFRDNKLKFVRVPADELIPLWTDTENSELDSFIRFYSRIEYRGTQKTVVNYAEYWSNEGVRYYKATDGGNYRIDPEKPAQAHFTVDGKPFNWSTVPLVWLKYNEEELPLSYFIEELVDSINWQTSTTDDTLRDIAKFIYVLKNYSGTDLSEFVSELRQSLAIKVDGDGGVDTIQPQVDVSAVLSFIDKNRRDIYDFANGVDTKDPDLGNASGTALQFRYMSLDNDCAKLGSALSAAFERIKQFADVYFSIIGKGDFSAQKFSVVFNTDMPINEADVIANCRSSEGIISRRTILENHPWVKSAEEEQKRLDEENEDIYDKSGILGEALGNSGSESVQQLP